MSRIVRIALTETRNAYPNMPAREADLGQLEGRLDDVRQANLDHHLELAAKARAAGANLLVCGELFSAPYFALSTNPMWKQLAESATDGPTVTCMRKAAAEHGMLIVAPIYELAESGARYNSSVVIDESGTIIGKYRKTHIPAGKNELGEFTETYYYGPSNGDCGEWERNISENPYFPVFETSIGKLAVSICYDRHFDGVMRTLKLQGAELVVNPAVSFGIKCERVWHMEFEIDAVRNNLFIAGSNRKGIELPWDQYYFGQSHVVGPNGRCDPIDIGEPALVIADADLDVLHSPDPAGWNFERDYRNGIYS